MGRRGRAVFGNQGHVFFVTTTVFNFDRVFDCGKEYYEILLASLSCVLREHDADLYAYVLMPNHIHLVVKMPELESISDLMRDFKKFTSTQIRKQLESEDKEGWLARLRKNARRSGKSQVFKLWMDRFDDFVITDEDTLRKKIQYIHNNPVRAGLAEHPEDWPYTSARAYLGVGSSYLPVKTDWYG